MKVTHKVDNTKGVFKLHDEGAVAAMISYSIAGDKLIIIDHTEVQPEYKGQGLGKKILMEVVNFARENQKKILPLCPFAAAVFKKDESIQDVLKQ